MVDRHKLSVFYTSPTAIRTLMKSGDSPVTSASLSSLRILGSVGEPINPEAWRWLYSIVAATAARLSTVLADRDGWYCYDATARCDTTEPGSCTFPFFGIEPVLLDEKGKVIEGNDVNGLLAINPGPAWLPPYTATTHAM